MTVCVYRVVDGKQSPARQARRERLTMVRIYEELQVLSCRGGDDAVRR